MTRVETIGVVGGGDAEGSHSVIRGLVRPANCTPFVRSVAASFEDGA